MLADLLVAGRVAAHAVAGVERVAAEQRIAGAFEAEVLRHVDDFEAVLGEPAAVVRLFALPLPVAEAREQRLLPVDHRRVRGEHQVGQPCTGSSSETCARGLDDVLIERVATARPPRRDRPAATCPSTD